MNEYWEKWKEGKRMKPQPVHLHSIGVIRSPFHDLANMPIQPTGDLSQAGVVEIFPEYAEGLRDLEGFSHLILIYYFHKAAAARLTVTPFLDNREHGIFATRAPLRPNPIGISVVPLDRVEENRIYLHHLDMLDGTPVLDLKPFVPAFDVPQALVRTGWMEEAAWRARNVVSDRRFE
jgi:tRNA (adenine37-N6)-methyltransferase